MVNRINISFTETFKKIVFKNKDLNKSYNYAHPNKKYSIDLIIGEIIFVLKTGIAWRNLRSSMNWNTLYHHYRRFVKFDIFNKVFNYLRNIYFKSTKSNVQIIDSSFIPNKYGQNNISRNKFYKNKNGNKISLLTDIHGVPLSVFMDKGSVHDISFMSKHLKDCKFIFKNKNNTLLADKGYESKKLRGQLAENNCILIIPKKKNSKQNYFFDKKLYKSRIKVENSFQKLKAFRKIMWRYDSLFSNYCSFVLLASSILIHKNL
jgi:transposase